MRHRVSSQPSERNAHDYGVQFRYLQRLMPSRYIEHYVQWTDGERLMEGPTAAPTDRPPGVRGGKHLLPACCQTLAAVHSSFPSGSRLRILPSLHRHKLDSSEVPTVFSYVVRRVAITIGTIRTRTMSRQRNASTLNTSLALVKIVPTKPVSMPWTIPTVRKLRPTYMFLHVYTMIIDSFST